MQSRLVVNSDLLTRLNIAQSNEQNVVVKDLHECIRSAGMIYVVRSVATTTSIETPPTVDLTYTQRFAVSSPPRFSI
jgi:hypothetical protein